MNRKQFFRPCGMGILIILTALFVLLMPTSADAANSGSCGKNLTWELSKGTLTITGKGKMTDYQDNAFAPWKEQAADIHTVCLPDGLTSVGALAFYGCENLTRVELPDTVTQIGDYAFALCTCLRQVRMPDSLLSIGERAFSECTGLTSVRFPQGLTTIGSQAFYRCESLSTVTVPGSVTYMGHSVFAYNTGLVQASICGTFSSLPTWTFYGCSLLSDLTLGKDIVTTGDMALNGCDRLNLVYTLSGDVEVAWQLQQSIDANNPDLAKKNYVTTEQMSDTSYSYRDDGKKQDSYQVSQSENGSITVETSTVYGKDTQDTDDSGNGTGTTESGNGSHSGDSSSQGNGQRSDSLLEQPETTITVSGVIEKQEGWQELADTVTQLLEQKPEIAVIVEVEMWDSKVQAENLQAFAGKNVVLSIRTAENALWKIDMSKAEESDFKKEYSLDITVSKVSKDKVSLEGKRIYQVVFSGKAPFEAQIGIPLSKEDALQVATFFRKKLFGGFDAIQSAVVDADGIAWFALSGVEKNKKYYVVIGEESVTAEDAVIPESLYENYDMEQPQYLTDSNGMEYSIAGRSSSWGMDLKTVMIILVIVVFIVTVVVGTVVYMLNRRKLLREKYRRHDSTNTEPEESDK